MTEITLSQLYRDLESRIADLENRFIRTVPEGEMISDDVIDAARAFRVLSHSEIEGYLEDRVLEVAEIALTTWDKERKPTVPLVALVGFFPMEKKKFDVSHRIHFAVAEYKKSVRNNNNGIRQEDIYKLLYPVGFLDQDIDELWLAEIDNFGQKRGDTAHSKAKQAQYTVHPNDEVRAVGTILQGLKEIDRQLTGFLSC